MKRLTIREARQALTHLEQVLATEGEVTLTRRGRPIARVVPVGTPRAVPSHSALRKSMPRMREPSERLIREDRDAR